MTRFDLMRMGRLVRILKIPEGLPDDKKRLLEPCLNRVFRIGSINGEWVALDVNELSGQAPVYVDFLCVVPVDEHGKSIGSEPIFDNVTPFEKCMQTLTVLIRENQAAGTVLAEQAIEYYCARFLGNAAGAGALGLLLKELELRFPVADYPFVAIVNGCIDRKWRKLGEIGI
jgi:hypothetical protein